MHHIYVAVYLFIIIFSEAVQSADWTSFCGNEKCFCKWQQGKKSALCNSLGLTSIPQNLSTELQVLILNGNNISYLNREEFASNLHLLNLQKIYLKKSRIKHVHREAFKNLKILIEIDLSDNEIETIDKQTFAGNERLRILSLYGNPIKHLNQFPLLKYLRTLDLHNCQISRIDETVFSNLDLLEYLDLKKNLLVNLPFNIFSHMKNLKTLYLEENPWNCDCRLKKFKHWYVGMTFKPLKCEAGRFNGIFWQNVETFGCAPQIELFEDDNNNNDEIGAFIGSNQTYRCFIKGDPLPIPVEWDFNLKPLDSDNIIIDVEEIDEDKIWSNLTIFNISSLDAGIYRCSAQSSFGFVSRNVSLILPEMVENVIIRSHPETFWYFGLILGIFSTIFCFIIFSILYCVLIKIVRNRNRRNIKSSVSFNDQEKKLLDLSITTNERQDFSEINTPSTSTNKTDSIIISLEPNSQSHNRDEFPLNVGVFTPPQTTYGNIFISVSVTQDAIDNLNDINMYPDLLNMPNRTKNTFIPIMPRKDFKASTATENMGSVELNSSESTMFSSPNFQSFEENYKNNESIASKSICEACKANEKRFHSENNEYILECENKYLCLKYDNMGRRVTADGSHSILSLSEDEQMHDDIIYKRENISSKDIPPTSANDFVSL